ncbi:uncharacterized protein with beta-barrel porin domain [Mesorhizobium robiniae]|uniref:Uncharacterized protein with beta-barrel porin domain n=1 Tax=Mesorhizobium robiniae TaxID=559315 RepID=A0ABV2GLL9_9HYPH
MKSKRHVRTVARILGAIAMVCAWSASASAQSCAPGETAHPFGFTGGQQTITVPDGVTQATVFLSGAQGGSGRSGAGTIGNSPNSPGGVGGLGGRVRGTLQVTPGDVLTIGVGGQGSQAVNPGGVGEGVDGIGGGATDLQRSGSRVAIAGGGGGGGNAGWSTANAIAGGAGGVGGGGLGLAGATVPGGTGPFGGGGGSVGTGGAGGAGCGAFPATAGGANGDGGDAFNFSGSFTGAGFGGGGGGGAVTGGGGGGAGVGTTGCQQNWNGGGGGGAGGSSGVTGLQSATINNGVVAGNGSALICFSEPRFFVGGTGSSASGPVTLQLNSSSGPQTVTVAAGAAGFTFPTGLLNGTSWSASIVSNPAQEICTLQPTSGAIAGADVTNLVLACTAVTVDISPSTLPGGVSAVAYSQTLTATSPNGATAPFSFVISSGLVPAGLTLSSAGILSGTPNTPGTFSFTVQATSANGFSGTRAYSLAIVAPVIAVEPANVPGGVAGTAYGPVAYSATGGTEPYSYALSAGALPAGMTLTAGALAGTPTVAGNFNFTVTATDANGFTGSRAYTLAVVAPAISIEPVSFGNGTAGTAYGPVALSAQGGTAPYSNAVSAGALPTGMTLTNGELTGTPTVAGTFNFTVTATDANGFTGARAYALIVNAPGIDVLPDNLANGTAGTTYGPVALSGQGGAAPYTFALTAGALPAGMSLTNGQLAGTPTAAGTFNFTVTATDTNGFPGENVYTLTIDAPQITLGPDSLPIGTGGVVYAPATFAAAGGTAPYSYTLTAGALPAGVTLTNGDLTGTPTVAGNFTFTVTATDAHGFTGERAYALTIEAPEITLAPGSLPTGNVFDAYSAVTISAQGGTAPYSFALTAGTLPAGLSLGGNQISGTPTESGSFNLTVTATDNLGFIGQQAYTLVIERTQPEAQDHTLTVLAGTTGTVDLTQGAVNGPFTSAAIVTPAPGEAGEATIVAESGTYILSFAASATFAGATSLTYTLSNSDGASAPATVTINVTARADPSRDPEVIGLIRAQTESTKRFANTQIRHFNQRLEQLHNEGERRTNSIGVNLGVQSDPNDPDAYAEEIVQSDPALDAIQRVVPDAATNTANGNRTATAAQPLPTTATAYAQDKPGQQRQAPATGTAIQGTSGSAAADPIVSDSPFGELALWSGGYVNFGKNDDGALKLESTLVGVSAGADYRFSPQLTAGLGFGYGRDVTDVGDNGTESHAKAISIAAYGSYRPVPGFFLDGLAGYSSLDFDSERYVTGTGDFASGTRSGDQIFASFSAGYEYRRDGLLISPYGRLSGSRSRLDGFTETGAGLDNLTFGEQEIDTLSGTLGLRLEKAMPMGWGVLTPRLRLEYTHDFEGSSRASMGYADLGTLPYGFDVEAFSQDLLSVGLGFDAQMGDGWNFGMNYSTVVGTDGDSQDHTVSAKVGIRF